MFTDRVAGRRATYAGTDAACVRYSRVGVTNMTVERGSSTMGVRGHAALET